MLYKFEIETDSPSYAALELFKWASSENGPFSDRAMKEVERTGYTMEYTFKLEATEETIRNALSGAHGGNP